MGTKKYLGYSRHFYASPRFVSHEFSSNFKVIAVFPLPFWRLGVLDARWAIIIRDRFSPMPILYRIEVCSLFSPDQD
jgi:lipid-A-disaccharide synthase-like uncharacterized protein